MSGLGRKVGLGPCVSDAQLGFGHPAVITVAAVLVISRALRNAGRSPGGGIVVRGGRDGQRLEG